MWYHLVSGAPRVYHYTQGDEKYGLISQLCCDSPSASTGGISKILVVCSPTRVHIADVAASSSIPVSPTRSSLTTQNSRKASAQFKTLHFDSEVVFVGAGIGVATVACHDGQVRSCVYEEEMASERGGGVSKIFR